MAHFAIPYSGNGFLTIYPDVHWNRLGANALCHPADGGSLPGHGLCHRQRNFLPGLGYTLFYNAVIGTEDQHTLFMDIDHFRP